MDAEDLLNGLEGLRSVIPGFLQGAYDDLINAIRQIYEGVTRFIAPTSPIDSGRTPDYARRDSGYLAQPAQ